VRFLDTNVLLYAVSGEEQETEKAAIAAALLQSNDLALSLQVLQEFYVQATRVTRPRRLPNEKAQAFIESWLRFQIQEMTVGILRAALEASQRFQLSYWDAAIIESARALGCSEVLSEDLNDGQQYAGLRVRNPFRPRPRRTRR